ncbi:MAG: 16S rRNA (uracil(1498)-N(3))-methyltransferase [Dehalococcoidia bacterium]|nr:16S rRNA (uracil(1498)-N(3))-methyltransferase [Dehalococcoidia bacterium]
MTRLCVDPGEFALEELRLTGARARRLTQVLRLRVGAQFTVFDGLGAERAARVAQAAGGAVVLAFGHAVTPALEPPLPVTLACAFPRGDRGDWIVEKTTELGVARIVPLLAERSVLEPGAGRVERWRRVAIEAAEQCGRARVPEIGGAVPAGALRLVAAIGASMTVREVIGAALPPPSAVAVFVGPEGDWTAPELAAHAASGAVAITLGPRVLRVDTAAVVAVAQAIEATGGLGAPGR